MTNEYLFLKVSHNYMQYYFSPSVYSLVQMSVKNDEYFIVKDSIFSVR